MRGSKMEKLFQEKLSEKLKNDLKESETRNFTASSLCETFGNLALGCQFLTWLCHKIDYYHSRLLSIVKNFNCQYKPRNTLSESIHQEIYKFWLHPDYSITSTDFVCGMDEI